MSGDDVEVAAIAVAAVKNLASHGDNFHVLRQEDALVEALRELLLSEEASRDLRGDIFGVLEELTDEMNDEEMDELDELEKRAGLVQKVAHPLEDPSLLKDPVDVRLHVPGLSDEMLRVRVEQLLIRKRGVISVVFEIGAEIAVLYSRAHAEELADYVAKMTGTSVEVLPPQVDDDDEEVELGNKENADGPGYLDHTGQRIRDVAKKNKRKNNVTQGASSLSERLKKQREEEARKKARSNRLLGSLGRGFNSGWGFW